MNINCGFFKQTEYLNRFRYRIKITEYMSESEQKLLVTNSSLLDYNLQTLETYRNAYAMNIQNLVHCGNQHNINNMLTEENCLLSNFILYSNQEDFSCISKHRAELSNHTEPIFLEEKNDEAFYASWIFLKKFQHSLM